MNISLPSIMAKVVGNLSRNTVGRVPNTWRTVGIHSISLYVDIKHIHVVKYLETSDLDNPN